MIKLSLVSMFTLALLALAPGCAADPDEELGGQTYSVEDPDRPQRPDRPDRDDRACLNQATNACLGQGGEPDACAAHAQQVCTRPNPRPNDPR